MPVRYRRHNGALAPDRSTVATLFLVNRWKRLGMQHSGGEHVLERFACCGQVVADKQASVCFHENTTRPPGR